MMPSDETSAYPIYPREDFYQAGLHPARRSGGNTIARKPVRQPSAASYYVSPPSTIQEIDDIQPATPPPPSAQPWGQAPGADADVAGQAPSSQRASAGPFMHYEDIEYFEPSPKEEDAQVRVRETDRLSTHPDDLAEARRPLWPRWPRRSGSLNGALEWLPEIIWCLLSLACLATLIALLMRYDGQSLPTWSLGITLNTLVAFLSTIARAAFVIPIMEGLSQLKWNWFARGGKPITDFEDFDKASRGPWGSIKLLGRTKGRFLSAAAALLLLTSLITSPLTQSVIAYPQRLVPGNGTAVSASIDLYSFSDILKAKADLDVKQKQGIQQGIYNPVNEEMARLAPRCSSGECEWDAFSSLAICVAINDVTDRLSVSQIADANLQDKLGLPIAPPMLNASLPNGVFLTGGPNSIDLNMSSAPVIFFNSKPGEVLDGVTLPPANQTLSFNGQPTLTETAVADFFAIYTSNTQFELDQSAFRAVEVLLHFCVNTYRVSVTGGESHTEQTTSTAEILSTNGTIDYLGGPDDGPDDGQLVLGADANGTAKNYTVNPAYVRMLTNYMISTFTGTYSSMFGTAVLGYSSTSDAYGTALHSADTGDQHMRDVILNVTQNVATSLTNTIRSLGQPELGRVFVTENYVQVRWAWLSCLALQVALSTAFLVGVILQTAVMKVKVLKGSALATMLAISAEDKAYLEREGRGAVNQQRVMLQRMGTITGKFGDGERGWRLGLGGKMGIGLGR